MLLSFLFHSSSIVELLIISTLGPLVCRVPITGFFDVDQDGSITEAEFNATLLIPWLLSELNNDALFAQFVGCSKRSSGCNGGLRVTAFTFYKMKAIASLSSPL